MSTVVDFADHYAEFRTDYTTKPDGALPTVHDTGQTVNTVQANAAWTPTISGGKVVNDPSTGTPSSATYIANTPLTRPLRRLAALVQFPTADQGSSSVALLNWSQQIHPETGGTHLTPLASCHFVISPVSWTYGFYYGNNQDIQFTHTFDVPLAANTPHKVEIVFDLEHGLAFVTGPDGETEIVRDFGQKWVVSTTYLYAGILVIANGNTYRLVTPGTSASSGGGPSGTGSSITDGTCAWAYVGPNAAAYPGSTVLLPAASRITDSAYCSSTPVPGWELYATSTSQQSAGLLKVWGSSGTARNVGHGQARTLDVAEAVARKKRRSYAQTVATVSAWAASTAYGVGQFVAVAGVTYRCTVAGTSAASGSGPSGNAPATDGTVTWAWVGGPYNAATTIADTTAVTLGTLFAVGGYLYKCTTAGTTGTGTRPTAAGGIGGTVTDGTVTWTRIALPGGGITPLTTSPQIVDRCPFVVPPSKRIIARVSEFVGLGATATDVYFQLGVSGVTSYGPGATKVIEQGSTGRGGLVAVEQILDLSAFSVGLGFDLTVHAFIGSSGAANVHVDTAGLTYPLVGTASGGKRPSIVIDEIRSLF